MNLKKFLGITSLIIGVAGATNYILNQNERIELLQEDLRLETSNRKLAEGKANTYETIAGVQSRLISSYLDGSYVPDLKETTTREECESIMFDPKTPEF